MKESLSIFFKSNWSILVLVGVVLLFFHPVWIKGYVPLPADFVVGTYYPWLDYRWGYSVGVPVKNPITTDVVSFIYPMQMLAIDLLKSSQWPLWNPYILAGTPLLANFQSAPFSPTNFLYWLFDRLTAWSIQIMLQHLLAAIFVYLLLRWWGVAKSPSVLGSTIFAFAGFNGIWSQWNGHALAAAFIPLLILLQDRFVAGGKRYWGILFSISVALQVFSGYPQIVFYTTIALVLLWIVRFQKSAVFLKRTLLLCLFGFLGLGLAAPQILPGAELLTLSQRETEIYPFGWTFLPWIKVITFFAPDYFGNHATQNYWGPQDYNSNTGFVSIVGATLAMLAIVHFKKPEVRFSFLLLIVALVLSFPTPVSIFFWKSGLFGLQASAAHRALVLENLAIALLAGFGAVVFQKKERVSVVRSAFLLGVVLGGFALVTAWLFRSGGSLPVLDQFSLFAQEAAEYRVGLRNLVLPGSVLILSTFVLWFTAKRKVLRPLGLGVVFFLMTVELFRFWTKFTPFSPRHIVFPSTPVLEFLASQEKPFRTTGSHVIPVNMRMPYKLESLEGYDAVYPLQISKLIAAISAGRSGTDPVGRYGTLDNEASPVLDLVNTRYYLTIKRDTQNKPDVKGDVPSYFDPEVFSPVSEDRTVAVLERKTTLPRAKMFFDWEVIKNEGEILDKVTDKSFPFDQKIILSAAPGIEKEKKPSVVPEVKYTEYKETRSKVKVSTDKDGILFISDTWYPGWEAYVDDQRTDILRANYAFRAIRVPKGEHTATLSYQPASFFNGIKLSFISLVGLGLVFLSYTIRAQTNKNNT